MGNHANLEVYITYIYSLIRSLAGLKYYVPDDDRQFYFLEGLSADYNLVIQAIRIPRETALTFPQILKMVRDLATNPNVAGSTAKNSGLSRPDKLHSVDEICRDYTQGKCKRTNCKYKHPDGGTGQRRCSKCGKTGHVAANHCDSCDKLWHNSAKCWKAHPELRPAKKKADTMNSIVDESFTIVDDPLAAQSVSTANSVSVPVASLNQILCADDYIYALGDSVTDTVLLQHHADNGSTSFLLDGGASCHVVIDRDL